MFKCITKLYRNMDIGGKVGNQDSKRTRVAKRGSLNPMHGKGKHYNGYTLSRDC
jgi:hypothetical protein